MPTCIAYCRVSTAQQKANETIGAQVERCRTLIERYGLTPLAYGPKGDGWVLDEGVSGTLLDGRHFATLLDDLESGAAKPDFLVVYSLSRINRVDRVSRKADKVKASHAAAARTQAALIISGTKVLDEEGPIDPGSMNFGLKALMASEEFKLIRERTMDGKSRRFREGRFAKGGHPPYGYVQVFANGVDRKSGFSLEPHPENAHRLRQLFAWYVEGGYTYAARKATEAEFLTPMASTENRKNKAADWSRTRWSSVTVMHIVRNAASYLGEQTQKFGGKRYTIKYEPLIDYDLYAAIQRQTKSRTLKHRAKMLTTGYVDCVCGQHIQARNTHDRHFSRCPAKCGSIRQEYMETYVWALAVSRLVQIQEHEGSTPKNEEAFAQVIGHARGRVAAIQAELDATLRLHLKGKLDEQTWERQNDALLRERADAEAEMHKATREREAHLQKRANEETVEARIRTILDELVHGAPTLERKREILADILQGGRVVASWKKGLKLTIPGFGALPPVTVRTDQDIWDQLLGPYKLGERPKYDVHVGTKHVGNVDPERSLRRRIKAAKGVVETREELPDGRIRIVAVYPDP